jgi:hypothetical protein
MLMRGSRLIPLLVAFWLLFISVVHACSGQDLLMSTTSVSASINESGMESDDPCRKPKQDICKSVRDQLFSLKAPSSVTGIELRVLPVLHSAHVDIPPLMNLLSTKGPPGVLFHPVFKSSFPFSNQVLRI